MSHSEFELLLDDLRAVQARRSAPTLSKATSRTQQSRAASAALDHSLRRTAAELEDMAKSLTSTARQPGKERRIRPQDVLAKALRLCREGRISALQVAEMEARLHRLAPVRR